VTAIVVGQRYIVTPEDSIDDAQASGRWLSCRNPQEVSQ